MSLFTVMLLVIVASLLVGVSVGLVVFRRKVKEMGIREFLGRLVRARGVRTMTARQLRDVLEGATPPLVVDLREPSKRKREIIPSAMTIPFDDFLRQVVVDGRFTDDKTGEIVLVCDHGNVSRVAGDVLAEDEGFTNVSSVRGGMSAWYRLQRIQQRGVGRCGRLPRPQTGLIA